MYAIYGNIYHQYTPNVSIYTSTMDPMGNYTSQIHRNPGFHDFHGVPRSFRTNHPHHVTSCCETVHVHLCLSAQLSGGTPPRPQSIESHGEKQGSHMGMGQN